MAVGLDDLFAGKSAVIAVATGKVHAWSGSVANDAMNNVACPGTSTCLAVSDEAVAAVKASTGAMKVTDKLKPPTNGIDALGNIACAGTSSCYAVGFEGSPASGKAIIVHLSAAGKQLGVLKPSGASGVGTIACPSSTLCLMSVASRTRPLAIQLLKNGRLGTRHNVPAKTFIQRIACYKSTVCYALGGKIGSGFTPINELFPLSPKTGAIGKVVKITGFSGDGLACMSATKCILVGFTGEGATARSAVVTVSHGKPSKPAKLGPAKASLADVACASATVCYAVGNLNGNPFAIKA